MAGVDAKLSSVGVLVGSRDERARSDSSRCNGGLLLVWPMTSGLEVTADAVLVRAEESAGDGQGTLQREDSMAGIEGRIVKVLVVLRPGQRGAE